MYKESLSPQAVVRRVVRSLRPINPSVRKKLSQARSTNPRPQKMSARLAFLVGRLRSQTKAINPRAARRFRLKRYNREHDAITKENFYNNISVSDYINHL
jgi:hypothetical protein